MMLINFGKYKNKSINEIFDIDFTYARWLYYQPMIRSNHEVFDFLQSKFNDKKKMYFEFGKYKGRELKDVLDSNDFNYLLYLKKCQWIKIVYPKLYKSVCIILDKVNIKNVDIYY
jgi:uncharacterized protein (DUF3820 family)